MVTRRQIQECLIDNEAVKRLDKAQAFIRSAVEHIDVGIGAGTVQDLRVASRCAAADVRFTSAVEADLPPVISDELFTLNETLHEVSTNRKLGKFEVQRRVDGAKADLDSVLDTINDKLTEQVSVCVTGEIARPEPEAKLPPDPTFPPSVPIPKRFVRTRRAVPPRPVAFPRELDFERTKAVFVETLRGGRGDGKRPDDFNQDELRRGMNVELEHTNDPILAMEIAIDHLTETPDYYIRLDAAGL